MKPVSYYILLFVMVVLPCAAQVPDEPMTDAEADSIALRYQMPEIVISNVKSTMTDEQRKSMLILRRRVLKVYPYAKIAAERLTIFNNNLAKLKSNSEKRKYSKIVEKYLEDEFEGQLKKLSRKDGQILVKLIHRQTGSSTFDLIKEYKSGWKAFWSNRIARVFDIDIKKTYNPDKVPEDFYIEGFLIKAFAERQLVQQEPAFEIDYATITDNWREKNKIIREKKAAEGN